MNFSLKNVKIKKIVWLLLVGTTATKAANFMSIPFIAIYLANNSQLSATEIGIILSISPFASLFGGRHNW